MNLSNTDSVLIVGITPYFLEKGNFWFKQNIKQILETRKTQSFFEDNTLYIEKSQNYNLSQFLRKLDEMGYERVWQVSEPGEFSQRGGIVDVFPINLDQAIRFEFLGNKIEEISVLSIKIEDELIAKEILKKKLRAQKLFSDLKGLKIGDYLVHLDHGVAQFSGIEQIPISKFEIQNYYVLDYAANDKLYVPFGLERKLSRYIGFVEPKISRLGSQIWQRTKRKAKEEAEKLAKELLEITAIREVITRPPYLSEDEIDFPLASGFQYEETPDQIEAIEEIKKDLEKNRPMDRIVCGDVGFGKTEVALRAMIKVVRSGYQAAMICPTTILANQHFQNFKERLKNLPIRVIMLSRLQSKKEQKEVIEGLKKEEVDIVIATHRLLSKDTEEWLSHQTHDRASGVKKGLGLLVIDDEHKFGVKQKEKLKQMKVSLDVLSLSATPIPRTLYMALSSLRDISLIQTPPPGRLPVKTLILPFSEKLIKKVIGEELKRGGQVYYLHNRIETIGVVKNFLENLLPKAKFGIAHGRLKKKELIKVMEDFKNRKIDVLIATTIIENGLDFPNVNTLIVADATKLGLTEAYQIRGRIGRSHIQALACFLYPPKFSEEKIRWTSSQNFSEKVYLPKSHPFRKRAGFGRAKMRLDALKEAEELGSGYKIALKDLEIRGAGNILGKEQSGNINQVGLNLYCQILYEAIEKIKQGVI